MDRYAGFSDMFAYDRQNNENTSDWEKDQEYSEAEERERVTRFESEGTPFPVHYDFAWLKFVPQFGLDRVKVCTKGTESY